MLAVALVANHGFNGSLGLVRLVAGGLGLVVALGVLAYASDRQPLRPGPRATSFVAIGLIGAAVLTSHMGLHYIFGGFAFGVVAARPSLASASAMTARVDTRGLVELVALAIGRSAGLLDTKLYAVLVIMAVVTTVVTSPGLRLVDSRRRGVR